MILDALKFVQGAVAKKDLVPELMHFRIEDGRIKGYNGSLALCSPIEVDMCVTPRATSFVKAIQTCTETIQLNMTEKGRLSVMSGTFRALIDCIEDEAYPELHPSGEWFDFDFDIVASLKKIAPFISEDASRPWSRGVLIKGSSAYATNNVVAVELWLGSPCPIEVNIPRSAVMELIRIGEEPTGIQVAHNSITFHYEEGRWLRSQLLSLEWPDVTQLLEAPSAPQPVSKEFFSALSSLEPFVGEVGALYFREGSVSTSPNEDEGASQKLEYAIGPCAFHHKQLALVGSVATKVDWSTYPGPCLFYGKGLRGALIGIRV